MNPAGLMLFGGWFGAASFDFKTISGLKLDINPAVGITTSGGFVEAAADQSGNGNDFVKVSDGGRPAFVASDASYNGNPVISFTGAQMVLKSNSVYSLFSNTAGMHIFIVGESSSTGDHYFCRYAGDTDAVRFRTEYQLFYDGVGGNSTLSVNTTGSANVMDWYWDPGAKTGIWVNGVEAATDTSSIPAVLGTGGSSPWVIGANSLYGDWLNTGKIARILIYAKKLGDADAATVRAALNKEYAIY